MKAETIIILGVAIVGSYLWFNRNNVTSDQVEQSIGRAEARATIIQPYSVPSVQQSQFNNELLMVRKIDTQGQLTTYKVDPRDLNPYQRWLVENDLHDVKNDVLVAKQFNPVASLWDRATSFFKTTDERYTPFE